MRGQLVLGAIAAIVFALGGLLLGVVGAMIGITSSISVAIVWRGALPLVFLIISAFALNVVAIRRSVQSVLSVLLIGGAVGYALNPGAWAGEAGFSQLVASPGTETVVGDFLFWQLAVAGGAWLGDRLTERAVPLATPYG